MQRFRCRKRSSPRGGTKFLESITGALVFTSKDMFRVHHWSSCLYRQRAFFNEKRLKGESCERELIRASRVTRDEARERKGTWAIPWPVPYPGGSALGFRTPRIEFAAFLTSGGRNSRNNTGRYSYQQAAAGCSRLQQAAPGCSRLQQAAAGGCRLQQAAAGCDRLQQAATGCRWLQQAAAGDVKPDGDVWVAASKCSRGKKKLKKEKACNVSVVEKGVRSEEERNV